MLRIFSRIINRRRCMNERWTKKNNGSTHLLYICDVGACWKFREPATVIQVRNAFESEMYVYRLQMRPHTHRRSHTFPHAYTIPGKKWSTGAKSNVAAAAIEPISVSIEPKNIIFYKQFINSSNIRGLMCLGQSFDQFPNGWIANMRCIYLHLQMPFYIFGKIY